MLPCALLALALATRVAASPAPAPAPAPRPTPVPVPAPQALSSASSLFSSVTGAVASALPTILGDWPSLSDIEKKLGVNNGNDLQNVSASALLIPSYANFSSGDSWNVRFYGLTYKLPNVNTSDLDSLINDLSTNNLNDTQKSLLQNRTQDLASLPIPKANLTALVFANGSAVTNSSGIQLATADDVGEFDQFVTIPGLGGNSTNVRIIETGIMNVTGPGNGTVILVPPTGISVVSDIDDVMRVTKVYVPNQGLFNSFVQPYVNVPGIPELYAHWNETLPGAAFHYDTTTPVELTRTYVDYLFSNFPLGSLEMRPINLTQPSQILEARQNSLLKLFQTFPQRKFVLVGDTSSSTLLSAYPQIAQQFPNQIACIFIRNTSATDPDDKIPYSTSDFKNLPNNTWFFYRTADGSDLFNLNITNGQCRNDSVPQNVTFGEQGGVLGNGSNGAISLTIGSVQYAAAFFGTVVALTLSVF